MPISGIFVFMIFTMLSISNVYAEQSGVLRIDIKKDSTEKILRSFLNDQIGDFLADKLDDQEFKAFSFGSDPKVCTLKNLTSMEITRAWTDCPGLPEWLFPDANPSLMIKPRPTRVTIRRSQLSGFNSGTPLIHCSAEDLCHIKIPIHSFKLNFDMSLTTLLPEPLEGSDKSFEFQMTSPDLSRPVSLTLPVNLRYSGPDHRWIESPVLDLSGKAEWSIALNQSIISGSSPEHILKELAGLEDFERLIPGLEFHKLPLLISAINHDLLSSDVLQGTIESLIAKHLNGPGTESINQLINAKLFNNPILVPLKTLNIGNFVSAERNFMGNLSLKLMSENISLFIKQIYSTSSMEQLRAEDEFSSYESHFLTFLQSLRNSSNEKDLGYIKNLEAGLGKIYQQLLELKSDLSTGTISGGHRDFRYISNCLLRAQTLFLKLLSTQERVILSNEKNQIQYKGTIIPASSSSWPYPLSFHILSDWGDSEFLNQHSGSVIPESDHDLAITVSIESLNQLLKDLHQRGVFSFSYYDQQNAALDSRPRSEIQLTWAPVISWDQQKKKYLLDIPEIYAKTRLLGPIKTWDTLHFKMWFLPEIRDGKFYLNPEISGSPKIISLARPLIMLTNFLKTATIVHPVVAKILINTLISGTGNELLAEGFELHEIRLEDDLLINFDLKAFSNRKNHISFYLSFP